MSSTFNNEEELSLSDLIMPNVYIRSLLIYDYHIDDFEELINGPQAFQCIISDDENNMINGRIVECENKEKRKVYSSESRINESIFKYVDNNNSIEELFPIYSSPLLFIHKEVSYHYLSDGHGFSLLGKYFSMWLKDRNCPLFDHDRSKLKQIGESSSIKFDHFEMSLEEPIFSSLNFIM
jgi:hypothetical protein